MLVSNQLAYIASAGQIDTYTQMKIKEDLIEQSSNKQTLSRCNHYLMTRRALRNPEHHWSLCPQDLILPPLAAGVAKSS